MLPLAPDDDFDPVLDGITMHGTRVQVGELLTHRGPDLEIRLGSQCALGRPVLVLQPAPHAPPEVEDDLRAEARLLARLDHPNILPVHAIIEDEGGVQVLVASVPGATWDRRLSQPHVLRDSFGATDVLAWHVRVLLDVCQAVKFAHDHGYLHRGLAPESVWIGDLGEVYLIDWALAVPRRAATPLGMAEQLTLRSAGYQPPEMLLGEAGTISERTDVYQLGGLLYRVLTGQAPHEDQDEGDGTLKNVLFRDPPIPHDAPPPLARVCKRALSRNPSARYPDVTSFAQALSGALAQRGAWQVAARADAHFDTLQRLLREPDVDIAAVYRTFGALRLGYEQALEEAPELQSAGLRLTRAAELVVQHLIERADFSAAEAVVTSLVNPPEHLLADIAEAAERSEGPSLAEEQLAAIGRTRDPRRDGGRRAWLGAVLSLLWVPTPLATQMFADTPFTPLVMVLVCAALSVAALLLAQVTSSWQASSRLTRDLAGWAIWGTAGGGIVVALGALGGVDAPTLRIVVAAMTALIGGTGAFSIDGRLVLPALAYGMVALLALVIPWTWAPAMFAANLVLAAVLLRGSSAEAPHGA